MNSKLSLLLVALAGVSAHDFKTCATDHLGLTSITLNPDPPVAGGVLSAAFAGVPDQTLTGGTATLKVSAFGITIATINFDLCKDMGATCPNPKGQAFKAALKYQIPSAAPKGISATCKVTVVDTAKAPLGCYSLTTKIGASTVSPASFAIAAPAQRTETEVEFLFDAWRRHFKVQFSDDGKKGAPSVAAGIKAFTHNLKRVEATNGHFHATMHQQTYHQTAGNLCYEVAYTDKHYAALGYKRGHCASKFNSVLAKTKSVICDGHSEANIKTCPTSHRTIVIAKKGIKAATIMDMLA